MIPGILNFLNMRGAKSISSKTTEKISTGLVKGKFAFNQF
jgi:hypothetical protein